MKIQAKMKNGICKVRIAAEMTIYDAAEMKPQLMKQLERAAELEVDLSGVSEFDSAGLQLLILLKREATRHGKVLRLLAHSLAVLEVLTLTRADTFFGDMVVLPSGA
jgi:anti-sigma B factor antagonist